MIDWHDKFTGTLLGMAVRDAIGLPCEGLSPRRAGRLFGGAPLRHRLICGRGMCSDDTEHACMTAQALLASNGEPIAFGRSLAWRLRGWLVGIPAGIGWGTLRAILKLWCGFPPSHSGVCSAGNGPAMRAPILGVWIAATSATDHDAEALIRTSTCLTHTDPRAFEGALVIALATAQAALFGVASFRHEALMNRLLPRIQGDELRRNLAAIPAHINRGALTGEFAEALGLRRGISGYINHTVPVALYASLRWPGDLRRAVEEVILLGGDTDTVASIVGGIVGAITGRSGIPPEWLSGLLEWPRSTPWLQTLAKRLADCSQDNGPARPLPLAWPGLLLRNPLFAAIVLTHGFRRLFPPY